MYYLWSVGVTTSGGVLTKVVPARVEGNHMGRSSHTAKIKWLSGDGHRADNSWTQFRIRRHHWDQRRKKASWAVMLPLNPSRTASRSFASMCAPRIIGELLPFCHLRGWWTFSIAGPELSCRTAKLTNGPWGCFSLWTSLCHQPLESLFLRWIVFQWRESRAIGEAMDSGEEKIKLCSDQAAYWLTPLP